MNDMYYRSPKITRDMEDYFGKYVCMSEEHVLCWKICMCESVLPP